MSDYSIKIEPEAIYSVGAEYCSFYPATGGVHWDLPPVVQKFIADFDSGKPVQPFEFEIPYEVPK